MAPDSTVFIVDDDPGMRRSLRWLIESAGHRALDYGSGTEFLAAYDGRAGCLVLDLRLPEISGLEVQRELVSRGFHVPVILLSAFAEVDTAVRAMRAGAVDVLEKPFDDAVLLARIDESLALDRELRETNENREQAVEKLSRLTPREREVMELVAAGTANKVIADELGISAKTVEAHRAQVMRKLEADSVPDLVRIVLSAGRPAPEPDG